MRAFNLIIPLVAAAVAVGTLTAAMPANSARHAHLVKSEPAANDTLAASPKELKLWYSERVELAVSTMKLEGAGGAAVAVEKPVLDAAEKAPVVVALKAPLAAGSYTIAWKVAGTDGHPSNGTIAFVVRAAR